MRRASCLMLTSAMLAGCGATSTGGSTQRNTNVVTAELRQACSGLGFTDAQIRQALEARRQDQRDGHSRQEVLSVYALTCQSGAQASPLLAEACYECAAATVAAVYGP